MNCDGQRALEGLKSSSWRDFLDFFESFNPWRTLLWNSAEDFAFKSESAELVRLILAESFWNEGSFYSNSAVTQIKVRLLSIGQLIEMGSRTSAGEKQGHLLSVGAGPGPRDVGMLPDWISGNTSRGNVE